MEQRIFHAAMFFLTSTAVLLALWGAPEAAASERCKAISSEFETAEARGNLKQLGRLYDQAKSEWSDCGSTYAYCLGRRIAGAYLQEAYRRAESGISEAALKPLLEEARKFGTPWQLSFALAEAEESGSADDRTRFDRAAALYQEAVNDIKEIETGGEICPGELELLPSSEEAEKIFKRTTSASRLAAGFVVPPTMRNGDIGGILVDSFRGFTPSKRPVPITFDYDEATLTAKGEAAAEFLLGFLKSKKPKEIRLTGHTDDKGSERYNCDLSKRRLDTVKSYLKKGGYAGSVSIGPLGEYVDVELDDPARYSIGLKRELNRRVELQLDPSAVPRRTGKTCG